MRQFILAILIILACLWLFHSYSKIIGKAFKSQDTIDSSETYSALEEDMQKKDDIIEQQRLKAQELREQQKRLIEDRRSKLQDYQRKH